MSAWGIWGGGGKLNIIFGGRNVHQAIILTILRVVNVLRVAKFLLAVNCYRNASPSADAILLAFAGILPS